VIELGEITGLDQTSHAAQDGRGQTPDFIRLGRIRIYSVLGVPSNNLGANNDFAFREDGAAGANTCIYHKESNIWVALTA
jgi:hypothetical protein